MTSGLHNRLLAAALITGLLLAALAGRADAQSDVPANGLDPTVAIAHTELLLEMVITADIDNNGVPDFDPNRDNIGDFQVAAPTDLELPPGSPAFLDMVRDRLERATTAPSSGLGPDCSGMVLSFDRDGNLIDWALALGPADSGGGAGVVIDLFPQTVAGQAAFTADNPFRIADEVAYFGSIRVGDVEALSVAWDIESAGIPIGGGSATQAATTTAGSMRIGDHGLLGGRWLPLGRFPVTGMVQTSGDGHCVGTGWVVVDGPTPVTSSAGLAAGILTLGGVAGLWFNARPEERAPTTQHDPN